MLTKQFPITKTLHISTPTQTSSNMIISIFQTKHTEIKQTAWTENHTAGKKTKLLPHHTDIDELAMRNCLFDAIVSNEQFCPHSI